MAAFWIIVLEQLWKMKIQMKMKTIIKKISTYHSINRKQLVPTFEPSMPFCHSTRNDARNVNRWILFLSSHDIKAQAFISLWQLDHSRMWMAFACSKSSNCCLEEKNKWFDYVGRTVLANNSVVHLQEELVSVKTFQYLTMAFSDSLKAF